MIPANELSVYVVYNPLNGMFFSARNSGTKCRTGDRIGSINGMGYWDLKFDGKKYKGHRVAWALMTGEWPSQDIDHINGVPTDNRWSNLRLASDSQNMANSKLYKNNLSGYKGVFFRKESGLFRAYIDMNGKRYYLGNFRTAEEASAARSIKAQELHGEFARVA